MSHTESWWVIWLTIVMLSSLVSMLPSSMVRCAEGGGGGEEEEGETAFIDQRAVAAGKNHCSRNGLPQMWLIAIFLLHSLMYAFKYYRVSHNYCEKWHTRLFGHALTQQAVLLRGDRVLRRIWFFEKNLQIVFFIRVRARYKLSLVFRFRPVCSKFKFMLSVGIQLFGLKTTSHGKPDLKNSFLRSD